MTKMGSLHGREYVCQSIFLGIMEGGHNAPSPIRGEPPKGPS